jgi:hypothetical protein
MPSSSDRSAVIRPICSRDFVALPNEIFSDDRLSADTRAMVALILSKPRTWQIRPFPLAKALSKKGVPLGRTRLARMFREAREAGYMARSQSQTHKENGDFDRFVYFVGMPDDVRIAVQQHEGVAFLAQSGFAHTHDAQTHDAQTHDAQTCGAQTQDEHRIYKRENPTKTDSERTERSNYAQRRSIRSPTPSTAAKAQEGVADDGYTALGRSAMANGMKFVFEESEPFRAWRAVRGNDGMPLIDVVVIGGTRRRGCWFPFMYPPDYGKTVSRGA